MGSAVAAAALGQSLDPAATAAAAPTTPTIVTAAATGPAVAVPGDSEPLSPALPDLEATAVDIEHIDAVTPLNNADTDPVPQGWAPRPGQRWPWHHSNYSLVNWHIQLGLGGSDLWEACFSQMTQWVLKHRFAAAVWCWERGPREGHRHLHALIRMHMPKTDIAATYLREEVYGWFHNGKPEGPDRVQFLHKHKAELHVDWLKEPRQSWRAMVGYLQKCRGRGFWSMEAVCDGQEDNLVSERTMFDGRR